jgi:uncharacterized protein
VSKFKALADYEKPLSDGYRLLPFSFTSLDADDYVLSNMVGEFAVLSRSILRSFVSHELPFDASAYAELKSKHFLMDTDSSVGIDLLALKSRTKLQNLSRFTGLHLFVVTLRCEHSCPYCQVSRRSDDKVAYDMSEETAEAALDLVFRSPSPTIKIEFQGGEPLLNFPRIRQIVAGATKRNARENRNVQFVIATNLAVVTDDILEFCKEHEILISTSLDGPRELHNANRPRPGRDSYERTVDGIRRVRAVLGPDRVGALMTTTAASLNQVKEIIDEYVANEFDGIFLRPLSPYGFAVKTKAFSAYTEDAWLDFYKEGLEYILGLNRRGVPFVEFYTSMIVTKMLTPFNPGYVDLQSPAGLGIAALVYNYDGDVYASDEGRMLAEMNDKTFRLGNVLSDSYEQLLLSDNLLDAIEQSFAASAPMCSECAFEPYCGADPVYHHATQGDFVGRKPSSGFCRRNMEIFRYLIRTMRARPDANELFRRWAYH